MIEHMFDDLDIRAVGQRLLATEGELCPDAERIAHP
jgi:hypothetical protein